MNNQIENISLNSAETQIKHVQIVNANNDSILSVSAEFRAVSAGINANSISLVSGGFVHPAELISIFNWSFNVYDQEKYLQLKTHDNVFDINQNTDIIPVSCFTTDLNDLTFNVSAYFNEISKNNYMSETSVSCILKNISVEWNTNEDIHLYFPNGNSLSSKEYNLNSLLVKKWNAEDIETGLYIDDSSISGVLTYNDNILSGSAKQLTTDELIDYDSVNLPVSAGFRSNNRISTIDTKNNVYIHIVDAQLKNTSLNFIVRSQDEAKFREVIERNLKGSSYINWINFDSDSLKFVTDISFSTSSLLNDETIDVSFTLGCYSPIDMTTFNIRSESISFTIINPVNWLSIDTIYINANENFDIVKLVCDTDSWDFDSDQYVKIIEPSEDSEILNYYEINYQNSEINSNPSSVLESVIPVSDVFNTAIEAKLYDPITQEKSTAADQKNVDIVVCSSNIELINESGIYNTPDILETRNGIPSSFVIENTFKYEYSPTSISNIVDFNFKSDSWIKTVDLVNGKDVIENTSEYTQHIDNKITIASAFLTINDDSFIVKPIKEFNIVDYGSPIFLNSIRPTLIFNINDVISSDISLFGYKNEIKDFDEKIVINDEVNIQTTVKNISGIVDVTNFKLPTNNLSWEELVSALPGLYIDDNGVLKGKVTDINVINELQKEQSLPYLMTVDDKTIALTFDYAYLSSYTGKSDEICEFTNVPDGLTINNNGLINSEILSKENILPEYNISLNVYDVFNGASSLLLSQENIANILLFDYKFGNDYLVLNELSGINNPSSVVSSWTKDDIFDLSETTFGLSSNIDFHILGDSLSCEVTSSNVLFKNINEQYEALTGEISAFANTNSSYCNNETLLLDTGKIIIPFMPNESKRTFLTQTVSYGKYYQLDSYSESKTINIEQFMQNANSNYTLPELLWKSSTLNGNYNDGIYTTELNDYGIFIFEDGSIFYKNNSSDENQIIDSVELTQYETNEYMDADNSIIFKLQNTNLDDYGAESLQTICIYDGFYILSGASVNNNTVIINIEFTQRKCMINHVSYEFEYNYDEDGNEILGSAPKHINMYGYDNGNIKFTHEYTPTNEEFHEETFNTDGPVSEIRLELETKDSTDIEYLVKIMNFKLSYVFD